jgi:photosystem II stability/assembly factor-like uncharacterized protein
MKKLFVVLLTLVAMSVSGQVSWFSQTIDTSQNLNYVKFFNSQTGFVTSDNKWYKTTNGGLNWIVFISVTNINSKYFVTPNLIWYSHYYQPPVPPYNPYEDLEKTVNGGLTWSSMLSGNGIGYPAIFFIDNLTGWVMDYYYLYRTSNGGTNWNYNSIQEITYGLQFLNSNYGYFYSGTNRIYKSTNSGINWSLTFIANNTIQGFTFLDTINGYFCGNSSSPSIHGMVLKTTNGGYNWIEILRDYTQINNINFVNNNTGYALFNPNTLYRTSNGGLNWSKQIPDSTKILNAIHFINAYTGWLVGNQGIVLYTTNGGSTFIDEIKSTIPYSFSLFQNYPNPFNPTTKIKFEIAKAGDVKIVVYDVSGREVQTLVDDALKPDTYETVFNGAMLTSGIYFCRLSAGDFIQTRRMVMIK